MSIGLAGQRFMMVKNEFEVVHVPRFREDDIVQFAEAVDATHNIYQHRSGSSQGHDLGVGQSSWCIGTTANGAVSRRKAYDLVFARSDHTLPSVQLSDAAPCVHYHFNSRNLALDILFIPSTMVHSSGHGHIVATQAVCRPLWKTFRDSLN